MPAATRLSSTPPTPRQPDKSDHGDAGRQGLGGDTTSEPARCGRQRRGETVASSALRAVLRLGVGYDTYDLVAETLALRLEDSVDDDHRGHDERRATIAAW